MNPFKVAFSLFGLIYAGIAVSGLAIAGGVVLVGVAGMLWCGAGWMLSNRYLEV